MNFDITHLNCCLADELRLVDLLRQLGDFYIPSLDSIVDIAEYAHKLISSADVLVASIGSNDLGLVAFYANDFDTKIAFLSSISVTKDMRGTGLAEYLLKTTIGICVNRGFTKLSLEVAEDNIRAVKFYRKMGFRKKNKSSTKTYSNSVVFEVSLKVSPS